MDIFLAAFITLFVIIDPLGTSAVFPSLVKNYSPHKVRLIAFKAAIVSSILLISFGIGGQVLLHYLGISIPAFRIAGGLLLFVTGFRMIMGFHDQDHMESGKSVYSDKSDIAIFPLAVPLLAGPGSMTATSPARSSSGPSSRTTPARRRRTSTGSSSVPGTTPVRARPWPNSAGRSSPNKASWTSTRCTSSGTTGR